MSRFDIADIQRAVNMTIEGGEKWPTMTSVFKLAKDARNIRLGRVTR